VAASCNPFFKAEEIFVRAAISQACQPQSANSNTRKVVQPYTERPLEVTAKFLTQATTWGIGGDPLSIEETIPFLSEILTASPNNGSAQASNGNGNGDVDVDVNVN
jgi:hypothetical protein